MDVLRVGFGSSENLEPYFLMAHSVGSMVLVDALRQKFESIYQIMANNESACDSVDEVGDGQKSSDRYPNWLIGVLPQLGNVPTATQKLFWMQSNLWIEFLLEFVSVFTNANLCTCVAKLALGNLENKHRNSSTKTASSSKEDGRLSHAMALELVALGVAVVAVLVVLVTTARIMKTYIFILNEGGFLAEDLVIETIERTYNSTEKKTAKSKCKIDNLVMFMSYTSK